MAGAAPVGAGPATATVTRSEEKVRLRDRNAEVARELARRTGLGHAAVNVELNRTIGLRKVSEATADQLRRRLAAGETWLTRV